MKTFEQMRDNYLEKSKAREQTVASLTSEAVYKWVALLEERMDAAYKSSEAVAFVVVYSNAVTPVAGMLRDEVVTRAARDVVARFEELGFYATIVSHSGYAGVRVAWNLDEED